LEFAAIEKKKKKKKKKKEKEKEKEKYYEVTLSAHDIDGIISVRRGYVFSLKRFVQKST